MGNTDTRSTPLLQLALLLGLCLPLPAQVPKIERPVTDRAGVLSPSGIRAIEAVLEEHRDRTGVQIAVLTVESTGGIPIENFSLKVAETWGGGSRGRDDGILFTLAVKDRTMRTEVGYGVEGYLPDAKVLQIQEGIKESLRRGDFDSAVLSAVNGIAAATAAIEEGRPIPAPPIPLGARMPWTYLGVFFLGGAAGAVTLLQKTGPATKRGWRIWNWVFGLGFPVILAIAFLGGKGFWWFFPVLYAASAALTLLLGAIWADSRACAAAAGLWYYALVPGVFLLRGQLGGSGVGADRWDGEELLITLLAHLIGCVTLSALFPLPYLFYIWNKQEKSGKSSVLGSIALSQGGSATTWSSGRSSGGILSGAARSWGGGGGGFGGGGATSSW